MEFVFPLLTLTLMEVVLGIDNIVFMSILVSTLPSKQQSSARLVGISLALVARIALLMAIKWVMGLDTALFHWSSVGWIPEDWVKNHHVDAVTGRDLVLLAGGAFLLAKSVIEIHKKVVGDDATERAAKKRGGAFVPVIVQLVLLDLVFSLDSVISAIGMAKDLWIMIVAMLIAVTFMGIFSAKVTKFIDEHPTFKMLALSFLMMIGLMLITEGVGAPIDKKYVYSAMVFALVVEMLNSRMRKKADAAARAQREATRGEPRPTS